MQNIIVEDLNTIAYKDAWDYQENIFGKLVAVKTDNTITTVPDSYLLYCEHPHVYTLGKSGSENNLLLNAIQLQANDATFYKTNRGGDITYHGPGQIVGYPIFDLEKIGIGIKKYIELLEQVIINSIKPFGIEGSRLEGASGVWLDAQTRGKARKICAIGVRASRHVTMHGFALNVNTNLDYFDYINPCGFTDKAVTSLSKELGSEQDMGEVKKLLSKEFENCFGIKLIAK